MRRAVVCGLMLLLGMFRMALATDYDLTIDPGSKNLVNAPCITVYEPFGLVKPGDHIISVVCGPLPNANMTCKLWGGSGQDSTQLTPKGSIKTFKGELRLGKGPAPSVAVTGALLMHVIATPPPVRTGIVRQAGSFLTDHPFIWILVGLLGVFTIVVAVIKLNSTPPGTVPVYGKKAYEENIREVKAKLERIMEQQEDLVKRPPVLRTYRKQIDRFDKRIEHLEGTGVTTQQALSVLASTIVEVQKSLDSLAAADQRAESRLDEIDSKMAHQTEQEKAASGVLRDQLSLQAVRIEEFNHSVEAQISAQSSRIEEFSKGLNGQLAAQRARSEEVAKELAANVGEQLGAQAQKIEAFGTGAAAHAAQQKQELDRRLSAQEAKVDSLKEAIESRVEALDQTLAAQLSAEAERVSELNSRLEEFVAAKSAELHANLAEELQSHVGRFDDLGKAVSEQFVEVREKLAKADQQAETIWQTQMERNRELAESLAEVDAQLKHLEHMRDALSVQGTKVETLLGDIAKLEEKSTAASGELLALEKAGNTAMAMSEKAISELKHSVESVQSQVAKLQPELESLKATNAQSLGQLNQLVASGQEQAATKSDLERLAKLPDALASLVQSVEGIEGRLSKSGLSREDLKKILEAHEKLSALSGDVSRALQKMLEEKLTTILTQQLAAKKGKESDGSGISDKGAAALSEVAQHLLSEIEQRRNLESLLEGVKAKLDPVPDALSKLEGHLADTTAEQASNAGLKDIKGLVSDMNSKLDQVPDALRKIESKLGERPAAAVNGTTGDFRSIEELLKETHTVVEAVPHRLDSIERNLEQVASKAGAPHDGAVPSGDFMALAQEIKAAAHEVVAALEQHKAEGAQGGSSEGLSELIADFKAAAAGMKTAAPTTGDVSPESGAFAAEMKATAQELAQIVSQLKREIANAASQPETGGLVADLKSATQDLVSAAAQLRSGAAKMEVKTSSAPVQVQKPEPSAPVAKGKDPEPAKEGAQATAPDPVPPLRVEVSEHPVQVEARVSDEIRPKEEPVAQTAPKKRIPAVASSTEEPVSEEWLSPGGNSRGTWSTTVSGALSVVSDKEKAMRPLTPTETPGIEYEVGAMLYVQNKVVYAHGDSVKAFWPGGNERSVLLSHAVPGDHWRLTLVENKMFCVEEKRVEIIDVNTWTRSGNFSGEYVNQCAAGSMWAGIRAGTTPVLEYRDGTGDLASKPHDLPKEFGSAHPMVSDGEYVYMASSNGEVLRGTRADVVKLVTLAEKEAVLTHLGVSAHGIVALVTEPNGLKIHLIDSEGEMLKTVKSDAKGVSGNTVVAGDKLYFFDPHSGWLNVCDLKSGAMLDGVPLDSVHQVRRMVGLLAGDFETLLVAGCDSAGKLGSVFMLDPVHGEQVLLCSTNQPHVDVIFAGRHPVVATSSSYQNIIRVFDPFDAAAASSQAA